MVKFLLRASQICFKNCTRSLIHTSSFGRISLLHFHSTFKNSNLSQFKHTYSTVPFKLSDIGEGIKEVTIKEWFVKEGDKVAQFDQICEVQSDKASVTITSRFDGIVKKIYYGLDEIAFVGEPLVDIELDSVAAAPTNQCVVQEGDAIQVGRHVESLKLPSEPSHAEKTLATPAVRRIASENKVELKDVRGTGKEGRVLKEDILNYVNSKLVTQTDESKPSVASQEITKVSSALKETKISIDRREPIRGYVKAMIKSMTISQTIPHFGYCDEVEISNLLQLRSELKTGNLGLKITLMPFFIKAASLALLSHPILNSSIDLNADAIIYKGNHNIGVAMDTKLGLIVPNIKNVEHKSILDIAAELAHLQELGLKGTLGPAELSGGTFTLSNIGSIGGTYAKPVILSPEVCIGAIGKVQSVPRFSSNGEDIIKANVFNISWSADHRLIDGATMARFSNLWKSFLTQPSAMLLHLK